MGETMVLTSLEALEAAFSILERIVMGETPTPTPASQPPGGFQYPRTDRDG